jgi:hypothetical protein
MGNLLEGLFFSIGFYYVTPFILGPFAGGYLGIILGPLLLVVVYGGIGALLGKLYDQIKHNKLLVIGCITLLLVMMVGLFFVYQLGTYQVTSIEECDSSLALLNPDFRQDDCYLFAAVAQKNAQMCERLSMEERDECYYLVASEVNDYAACGPIQDEDYKARCISDVAQTLGECEKSADPDYCYAEQALTIRASARDKSCGDYVSKKMQEQCYAFAAGSITLHDLCLNIKDPQMKDECMYTSINGREAID